MRALQSTPGDEPGDDRSEDERISLGGLSLE
jgi:hypothetical protein